MRLLNVSYDPTREFYQDYNATFAPYALFRHMTIFEYVVFGSCETAA